MAYCDLDLTFVSGIIGSSVLLSLFSISILYMLGAAIRSTTIGAWTKIELYQVAFTVMFVSGAIFMISTACAVNLSFFTNYVALVDPLDPQSILPPEFTDPAMPYRNMFESSTIYLNALQQ